MLKERIRKGFEVRLIELVEIGFLIYEDVSRMGFQWHVMRCVSGRRVGEARDIHGGGMKCIMFTRTM